MSDIGKEDHLKMIIDAIPDAVWVKDINGVYLTCNKQLQDLYQRPKEEIVGKTHYDILDKDIADLLHKDDIRCINTQKPTQIEAWLDTPKGLRLFEGKKTPLFHNNKMVAILGISRDITEHYEREKLLKQTDKRLSVALKANHIGIWEWDLKEGIAVATPSYYTMLGYDPAPRIDTHKEMDKIHPEDKNNVMESILGIQNRKNTSYDYEARIRNKEGNYVWINTRCAVTEYDEEGKISKMLGVRINIDELKQAQEKISWQVYHDSLTGLPNRLALKQQFSNWADNNAFSSNMLALLFIDLDRFKNVNDTYGHSVGDKLLIKITNILSPLLNEGEILTRQGGDEFILMLPGSSLEAVKERVSLLTDTLSSSRIVDGNSILVSASVGVSLYPQDGEDLEGLLKCADIAMYQAKHEGRNIAKFYSPSMHAESSRAMEIESALLSALENNEFYLHFQPQLDTQSKTIIGAEVLIRWNSKKLGIVSPGEFIPVAEDCGLILDLGKWVLDNALKQFSEWRQKDFPDIKLSVNLSMAQFRDPDLPEFIQASLAQHNIPPELLELELTERVALNNPESAIETMHILRKQGIQLAIDDFGIGYSSMSYLKRFPINMLKIDQSFIRNMEQDKSDSAIISATIALAKNLGLKSIAEGVETGPQFSKLNQLGCFNIQGFWVSKPLPNKDFVSFIESFSGDFIDAHCK